MPLLLHALSLPARDGGARSTSAQPMTSCVVVPKCSHGRSGLARSSSAVVPVSCHVHDLISHRCSQAAATASSASTTSAAAPAIQGSRGHSNRSPCPAFLAWIETSQCAGPPRRRSTTARAKVRRTTNCKVIRTSLWPVDVLGTDTSAVKPHPIPSFTRLAYLSLRWTYLQAERMPSWPVAIS